MDNKEQRVVIVAGPPATGKTSVMINVIKILQKKDYKVSAVKMDCLSTDDDSRYSQLDIPVAIGLSEDICPDHFLAVNLEEITQWSSSKGTDILIIETAGLCHRCAPGTEKTLSVCVVDNISSIKTPEKIGPVITTADIILITRGDLVSQAEREVFVYKISELNPKARIVETNGLSGFGSELIADMIIDSNPVTSVCEDRLRHDMPTAICSYCVGEMRIGKKYQQGIIRKMDFGN